MFKNRYKLKLYTQLIITNTKKESVKNLNADISNSKNEDCDDEKEIFKYRAEVASVILESWSISHGKDIPNNINNVHMMADKGNFPECNGSSCL